MTSFLPCVFSGQSHHVDIDALPQRETVTALLTLPIDLLGLTTSESEEESESEAEKATVGTDKERNSLLTVGHKNNRTFVVRGDKIGVFKHAEEDGKVDYAATIRDLGFKGMKSFKRNFN